MADEANGPVQRRVFVDFMYAVVVGSALPLISDKHLDFRDPVLYGMLFLFLVVLEDYILYETQIAKFQDASSPMMPGLAFEISVLICWYFAAVAIPEHVVWFLYSLSLFFFLKFASGWAAVKSLTKWQSLRNLTFFLPMSVAMWILHCKAPTKIEWPVIVPLALAWLIAVAVWWRITNYKLRQAVAQR